MAKRKPPTPRSNDAAPGPKFADELIDRVVLLLVTIRSRAEVQRLCVETPDLALEPKHAAAAVELAAERIQAAAAGDLVAELGAARIRLAELFSRAANGNDFKTALAAQKETNKLLALYIKAGGSAGSLANPDDAGLDAQTALAELAHARAQLAPLVDLPDQPLDDIARRVVALFTSR